MIKLDKNLPLNIYRASAGSGKTHLLTGFYIKLLFDQTQLPEQHSGEIKFGEILAVTFTNKATAEMKGRIIDELFLLSVHPEKSDYWEDVAGQNASRNDESAVSRIRQKATQLLVQILNEYASFNISTIDSFFLRIVRSFARELNIPGNYDVELNSDRVLDAALSNFMDKLDDHADHALFEWMVTFSKQRLADGAGWDVRQVLLDMAKKVLTSETYRQHSKAIHAFTDDKAAMRDYVRRLQETQRAWREELKQIGEAGLEMMQKYGVPASDFKWGGSGTCNQFTKWADGLEDDPSDSSRYTAALEDPESIYKNKPSQDFIDQMQALMQRGRDHFNNEGYIHYCTASAIRTHFYELGIMANLDKELMDYCNEQNTMLLSSTTDLLSRLIDHDDAPFIYEKTGTHIHSYMIDEFQDTSGMQWGNFKPLVSNALSEGYQNLIVGDVKQSIYRWRGGDWNLLNSEINGFEPTSHYDDETTLGTNWRSLPSIVNFNNAFFPWLAGQLDGMLGEDHHLIRDIYHDVTQLIPDQKKGDDKPQGLVHLSFLTPKDDEGNPLDKAKKEDYKAEAARRLPEAIIRLQESGFEARDIAILCRLNDECQWVADVLLRYKQEHPECKAVFDIISGEALKLSARPVIHVLLNLMRHLQSPKSPILCAVAHAGFLQLGGLTADEALSRYFALPADQRLFHPELAHRPFYEVVEQLIQFLPADVQRTDAPYLQAFRDVVLEYSSRQSGDLSGFLEWWDQSGYKKAITTPEGQNAIQIMSVHKSKGLGMPAIILPFASWDLDIDTSHDEIIWCEPKVGPFAQEVLLPLKLDKGLSETIFAEDFLEERRRAIIDNLNTVYVALTRAKEAMILLTPQPKSDRKGSSENTMLEHYLQAYCEAVGSPDEFTMGTWQRVRKDRAAAPDSKAPDLVMEHLPGADINAGYNTLPQLSILHDPARPDITAKQRGTYIHAVLQDIRTAAEAHDVIRRHYMRGDVDPEMIAQEEMLQIIDRLLAIPQVAAWFRPGLQVLNELSIMDSDGRQQRPDRIVIDESGRATVIDYKTGSSHKNYRSQVIGYMNLLRQLGYTDVSGYLLFLKDEKVVNCGHPVP